MRVRRQDFLPGFGDLFKTLGAKHFGGSLLKGNPQEARPISTKNSMHLVLRSTLAVREKSFLHPSRSRRIQAVVYGIGKQTGVKVYRYANSGNHLHLVILPISRRAFRSYIRAISGLIARITLGAERGDPKGLKFWDARPFSRIVEWGKDFRQACAYLVQNTLEAIGFIPFTPRKYRQRMANAPTARASPSRRVSPA